MRTPCPSSTCPASALDTTTIHATAEEAARAYGAARGISGRCGWLYGPGGERLANGWAALARRLLTEGAIIFVTPGKPADGYRLAAPAPLEIIASVRSWLIHRGARMLVSGPLAGPRRSDDELRELIRQRLRDGRIPSLVDERELWNSLAAEITGETSIVRASAPATSERPASATTTLTPPAAQDPELQDVQGGEAGAELLQDPEQATTPAPIASLAEQGTTEIRVWPRTGGGRSWEIYRNGKRTGLGGDLFKPLDNAELRELARRQMDAMPGARWVLQEDIKVKRLGAAPTTTPAAGTSAAEQGAQEAIAVKRGGGGPRRRPTKSTTLPPATEAPASPPVLPPVPSKPVKTPPKRPRPAPSASPDPYAADAELPSMEPTTREQIKARREVGARHFLDAVTHVLSGRPVAAQHSLIDARGAFRRAAYEAEVLAMAEHREAAAQDPEVLALDAAEQEAQRAAGAEQAPQGGELPELREQEQQEAGEGGGLGEPRPEIAGLARTLIRERSGGGEEGGAGGAQRGDPGGGSAAPSSKRSAATALSPELRAEAALITNTPERLSGGGEAEHSALPRMTPIPPVHPRPQPAGESTPPPRSKRKPPASSTLTAPRPAAAPRTRRAAQQEAQQRLTLTIPPHVAELARFALGVGIRASIFPPKYTLHDFITDAAFERASILAAERALCINAVARWGLVDEALFLSGEGGADHAMILEM